MTPLKEMPASAPPSSPVTDTVRLFITVSRMHHCEVERRVANLGIHHSQHRMLMQLSHCDHTPSQRELADVMGISPAAVTTTLKCLEKEGYVSRSMTDEDNRRNDVAITEAGRQKIEDSRLIFDSVDQTMFQGFSEDELQALSAYLRRMSDNLSASRPAMPSAPDEDVQHNP